MVRHKDEFKNGMDRIAKKAVDIENDMNRFRRTVGSAVYNIDERIRALEEINNSI
jgi:hypothetical protein